MPGHEHHRPGHETGHDGAHDAGHDDGHGGAHDAGREGHDGPAAQQHGWARVEGVSATDFWEEFYGATAQVHSGGVNAVLAEVAGPLAPGTALDLGCGEGGDAVWLAARGWRVTAVDASAVALARGARAAEAAGVADLVTWEHADLAAGVPGGGYDLVSAQYLHTPTDLDRGAVLRAAADAVAPGGLLLVVGHLPSAVHPGPPAGADGDDLVALQGPEEVLADLALDPARWRTERCGAFPQTRHTPDGERRELVDGVVAVRRTA